MVKKLFLFLSLVICVAAAPGLWAEEAPEALPTVPVDDEALAPETAPAEPQALPRSFEQIVDDEARADVAGCTASMYCIHGGQVSCSSPVNGTCSSSGAGCGLVVCNGQATWCPGRCHTAWHCASFCYPQGSTDGYCDEFGCCVCL